MVKSAFLTIICVVLNFPFFAFAKDSKGSFVIEGTNEQSPIETMRLPEIDTKGLTVQTPIKIEDPTEILNDPEVLLAIPRNGLALPIQRKQSTKAK